MSLGGTVATVAKAAFDSFQTAMQDSFDKGRKEGYAEGFDAGFIAAQKEIMAMISGIGKHRSAEKIENRQIQNEETDSDDGRAAPGTVKPAILKLIQEHPEGLSKSQIVMMTGIKPNSVRGTLWSLNKEGHIKKSGRDLWVPVRLETHSSFEDLLGSSDGETS
ncbi:hypothetical protein [Rhizobium sp. CF142]|uniref:hypothetical protein n=1 Tax=Rhizobium sp. CF142 TaxID=1144314 RepID=UPI00026EFAA3|nr:hypothetical protein [Rhizobium sp. CF142]EJJ24617.1 hypothetical protein PMI11_07214 [Rhizobium sp. CF142]